MDTSIQFLQEELSYAIDYIVLHKIEQTKTAVLQLTG